MHASSSQCLPFFGNVSWHPREHLVATDSLDSCVVELDLNAPCDNTRGNLHMSAIRSVIVWDKLPIHTAVIDPMKRKGRL